MAGERFLRKSMYADGGVMGVLMDSSRFRNEWFLGCGLRSSEGYEADTGVWTELPLTLPSMPEAADIAAAVAAGEASVVVAVADMVITVPT